jgi:predicted DNA-binding transcriptional regulator AlpA
MPDTRIGTKKFREEANRRLIDTWELMLLLGLRNKQSVHDRVKAGKLPAPVITKANVIALWDRDEIEFPTDERSAA